MTPGVDVGDGDNDVRSTKSRGELGGHFAPHLDEFNGTVVAVCVLVGITDAHAGLEAAEP